MKIKLLTTGLMAGILSVPSVQAAPIPSPFGIKTTQYTSSGGVFPVPATQNFSTDTAFSNTLDNGASIAQGNLATGEVGAFASGDYQTDVTIYDTLSFDSATATEVFFDIEVDALLATDSIFEHPRMFMRVGIYDITGLDSWLETSTGLFVDEVNPVGAAQEVFAQIINIEVGTTSLYGNTEGVFSNGLTSDGTLQYASWSVAESFVFDPAKIYGIGIIGSAYASDGIVDGLNTGVFSFTDLNGTSFTSGSGTFLSAQTAVPIPAAAWMFGSALFGLSALKRKAVAA